MTDLLDKIRDEIGTRSAELEPVVSEYKRLQAVEAALNNLAEAPSRVSTTRAAPKTAKPAPKGTQRRPRRGSTRIASKVLVGSTSRPTIAPAPIAEKRKRTPARRQAGGTRAIQVFRCVAEHPGITIAGLEKKTKISRTSLHRIVPGLELEGKVARQGTGWYPRAPSLRSL